MNERIKELWEQVGITWKVNWRHQDDIYGTMTLKQFEKFAELIVQECGDFTDPVTRNLMMKHFGVEK